MKWISVKDKLPEENMWVLYCSERGGIVMGFFDEDDKIWVCVTDLKPFGKITHWMPLPEPPKE